MQSLAKLVADDRPYQPTVHVLILPSQLPLDLRLHFRDLDEARFVSISITWLLMFANSN